MKTFRYKFSRAMIIIIAAMFALGLTAFGITLWQSIEYGLDHTAVQAFAIAKYILLYFVSLSVVTIAILFVTRSYYRIGGGKLKMCFAALPTAYNTDDIDAVIHDRTNDSLSVYFKDDTSVNIVIKREQYSDFVQAVLDENPSSEYSIRSKTSTEDDDNNK